ncbi:MAG: heparan-alpha-glucosaminide N-acetyltransferase domain-containing protein [Nitrosomonas sp.]|nr:heparan-alpha-glucosaminide N-acetyltransferase domain-containing protein [Nitrosomonas sp.]
MLQLDKSAQRIAAIDWLRGIVMILMALDHTSWFFNTNRIFADSILLYESGDLFAADQFLTRWITHICAPTFVFLAGTSIAISNIQRREQGISNSVIDRELLLRGAFIALLDLCVFSLASEKFLLQVLYAIGISMMLMVPLQHLGARVVLFLAVLILAGSELLLMALWQPGGEVPLWLALTFAPVFGETYTVLYPALPWLAIMMLGWVFGERLMSRQPGLWPLERLLMVSGLSALVLFVLIRSSDGYGNLFMHLEGNTLVHWLHISKYPPSLAYTALELSLMAIIFALLIRLESVNSVINNNGPILVFGQTALFFYLAHFCVLAALRLVLERGSLEQTYWITLLVLIILYPICRIYRSLKWRYPQSLLRFL